MANCKLKMIILMGNLFVFLCSSFLITRVEIIFLRKQKFVNGEFMISEYQNQNPFLILDTAIFLIKKFCLISEDKALDFNRLRQVSLLFQEIIDANGYKLYPDFAFKCREAYFNFYEKKLTYDAIKEGKSSWSEFESLQLARQTYLKEKSIYTFFSMFSGPLVTYERIIKIDKSFDQALKDIKYNLPRQIFKGHDKTHGPFVTGCFCYGKRKRNRMFLVSPIEYRVYVEQYDKLSMDLQLNQKRCNFLKDLMQKGFAHDGDKKCQWIGHEDWKNKYNVKPIIV